MNGTLGQSAPRTCPPAQRQTSALPSVLPLMRMVASLKACRHLMPRFIGGYYLSRSSTPLTRVSNVMPKGWWYTNEDLRQSMVPPIMLVHKGGSREQ